MKSLSRNAGTLAVSTMGTVGIFLALALAVTMVMGYYERSAIEARLGLLSPLENHESKEGAVGGRVASQPRGSAVVPPSPNDQARVRHIRLAATERLQSAAGRVLENQASLAATANKNRYLSALYVNERSKAASQVMRRELLVGLFLVAAGLMSTVATW